MVIHSRNDVRVEAFGTNNDFGYLISYGEAHTPLLSSNPVHHNAEEAQSCGEVMLEFLRGEADKMFGESANATAHAT